MQNPASPTPDTTSTLEPSERLKAHPYLMGIFEMSPTPARLASMERQALAADRLKEEYSSDPFHQARAAKDPEYWSKFSDSAVNY